MSGLRPEDYVAFLDESGNAGLQVVSGILIPVRWLRPAERRWEAFIRNELGSRSGRVEVKSRELVRGEAVSLHAQRKLLQRGFPPHSAKGAGRRFYREALRHIASIAEVRILTVGLPTNRPEEVYRLWYWLCYAALIERPKAPRPRLPLIVIDGEDRSFRLAQDLVAYRFYKSFPRSQPYVTGGKPWFVGGSVLQDSKLHPFVQMADLLAGAGWRAMAGIKPADGWYRTDVVDHAKGIGYGRAVDFSRHAMAQLKRRSRKDACGSGWPNARLVP